jgi:hypothetical protein
MEPEDLAGSVPSLEDAYLALTGGADRDGADRDGADPDRADPDRADQGGAA